MQKFRTISLVAALLVLLGIFLPSPAAKAAITTLNSKVLSLKVTTNPYSYQVVERSSSQVLISQHSTTFNLSGTIYSAASATRVTITSTTLDADLALSGTSHTAHVKFTFTSPQVLHVHLTFNNGTPTQVTEQFNDQQEHYYGIWEYPFNGKLDNRGN